MNVGTYCTYIKITDNIGYYNICCLLLMANVYFMSEDVSWSIHLTDTTFLFSLFTSFFLIILYYSSLSFSFLLSPFQPFKFLLSFSLTPFPYSLIFSHSTSHPLFSASLSDMTNCLSWLAVHVGPKKPSWHGSFGLTDWLTRTETEIL